MIDLKCRNCKNYISLKYCNAFMRGIPNEIYLGFNDHSKPLPDQNNDIVFEEIK